MTDARSLLDRHRPRLVYDSQEAYFADAAKVWTDSPTNALRRADGTVLAKPPKLSLAFLGPGTYGDGTRTAAGDVIGDGTRTYAANAAAMHRKPGYANRVYGHARRDPQGRLWLQYWLFYYYNDFRLLGPLSGGKHEGDWELVQLRLDAAERPDQAIFSQHTAAEAKRWADVRKSGQSPLVYVARGSHANYFRPGSHWTSAWWDQADGKGPQVTPALEVVEDDTPWMLWPGRWGDTKSTGSPIDSTSPTSPGRRPHWLNPALLGAASTRATVRPPTAPPRAPRVTARHEGTHLVVTYEAPPDAAALVIAERRPGQPARTRTVPLDASRGELELPAGDHEVWISSLRPDGAASEGVKPT
jgi:hypothetical protein